MENMNKVLYNVDQRADTTEAEKATARANIGVEALPSKTGHAGDVLAVNSSATGLEWVDGADTQEQSNWAETNPNSVQFIQNKPDLSTYATQADLAGKQDTLTAGQNITISNNIISATAAPQEQADWAQSDSTAVDYIKNKPTIPVIPAMKPLVAGNNVSIVEGTDDVTISATAAPQLQANWNETSTSSVQFIQNKPTIPTLPTMKPLVAGSNITITEGVSDITIESTASAPDNVFLAEYGVATVAEISAARNAGKEVFTLIPGTYYPTVAYLREVTRNGANANFASVTSDGASVKTATVDSSGNWSNSTVNLATTSGSSLVQKKNYGDTEPSRVATLLIDSDDPEGYAQVKADSTAKGYLVVGPYKGLLDSGINGGSGIGTADVPVYIDSNGTFQTCNTLTAGYRISISPGANNTTVIGSTMHESVINTCLSWDTLANTYDFDYFWGNWRCHVHLAAFSDWAQDSGAIHIRLGHVYAGEAAQKIKCGSYQVQSFFPYKSGSTYDFTNTHWYYTGTDPYTTATSPDPYGFAFHLLGTTPTEQEPDDQAAHRFIVDTGAPYGDWLELDASVRFMVPNAAPAGNGIYLVLKGKYAYSYQ